MAGRGEVGDVSDWHVASDVVSKGYPELRNGAPRDERQNGRGHIWAKIRIGTKGPKIEKIDPGLKTSIERGTFFQPY